MKLLIPLFFLFPAISFADSQPRFHCYSFGNQPADAYESESSNCASTPSVKKMPTCLYAAGCMPVAKDAPTEPPVRSVDELGVLSSSGVLLPSFLHCEATGMISKGGVLVAQCPSPTNCQSLSYNRMYPAGTEAPADSKPVPVAIPPNGVIHEE